jgi:solute carrier family 25 (mitochondrial carnitine/acylcarnitine transporter), member 20/29
MQFHSLSFHSMKVRMQTSTATSGILQTIREFGGVASLFRGMGAPLGAAAAVNATVFSGYGFASRLFDQYITEPRQQAEDDYDDNDEAPTHDPWQKSLVCGSFAGAAQCVIVCPMEHIKCRLQTQNDKASADSKYKGPIQATRKIISKYGFQRLYQGWWSTFVREVPAFGLYFASYDYMKDRANSYLLERDRRNLQLAGQAPDAAPVLSNTHTWLASAVSGGFAGSWTWAIVYPVDLIKSKIQTAPLDTPLRQLGMWNVGKSIVEKHGARALWRGLGITLIRAFPVNGTIFPVYEFTLKHISSLDVTS